MRGVVLAWQANLYSGVPENISLAPLACVSDYYLGSTMHHYLVLAKIKGQELFSVYIAGHLPTITVYDGSIVFRSTGAHTVHGCQAWDVVAIHYATKRLWRR